MSDDQRVADLELRVERLSADHAEMRAGLMDIREHATAANHRADASEERADASEVRADKAELRANDTDARADLHSERMDTFEDRLDVDEAMIADLQAEGLLSQEHAKHLEEALRSSRLIGSAMGIVMATRQVDETGAFLLLSKSSQNTNRKLRTLAEDIVRTGDVSGLPLI